MEKINSTQKRLEEQSENILLDFKYGASISMLMRKYKFSRPVILKFLEAKKDNQ